MKEFFSRLFDHASRTTSVEREWDRQRSLATSPSELSEIDAIFSRNI